MAQRKYALIRAWFGLGQRRSQPAACTQVAIKPPRQTCAHAYRGCAQVTHTLEDRRPLRQSGQVSSRCAHCADLDARTIEKEGLDVAAKDFLAGMTDRYAVNLFERLFVPKPWVSVRQE